MCGSTNYLTRCAARRGEGEIDVFDVRTIVSIILLAVAFGALMGYRNDFPFGWERALLATLAFSVLGLLISYIIARRK